MENTMFAIIKKRNEVGLDFGKLDIPKIKDNEVLIKIMKTSICGTDLHIYNWDDWAKKTIPFPIQVGHEMVGTIVEIGKSVDNVNLKVGDRVSAEGHIICGYCRKCRAGNFHLCPNTKGIGVNVPGAFAQYIAVPGFNVFKIPSYISDNIASILDPFGNAIHSTNSFELVGEDVLITGAGPIGCMATQISKKIGARNVVVIDINDYRLNLAKEMGADLVVNVSQYKNKNEIVQRLKEEMPYLNMVSGFDVGLEMSGVGISIQAMLETMIHGGKIALLGINSGDISISWDKLIFKSLIIKGIYGREMFETWYKMISLVKSGLDIEKVITHEFSASEFEKGIKLMQSGQCGKVILDWSNI